ncbi:MAG TPA: Na+/H+ antiporter subunit G [Polyangiaceae bacterium]|nr:Na+/H+ antiporter subunit G [Polyangiaceae bacterium]
MSVEMPLWAQLVVALLLVCSGLLVLISATGLVLLQDFFQRMHPPAIAYTLGSWCVALAGMVCFSVIESGPALHPGLISILLAFSVPVTTVLLARASLFRRRAAGIEGTPPPLSAPAGSASEVESPVASRP